MFKNNNNSIENGVSCCMKKFFYQTFFFIIKISQFNVLQQMNEKKYSTLIEHILMLKNSFNYYYNVAIL